MGTLKEKVARVRKLDALKIEFKSYTEAARKQSKFTQYYMDKACAVGYKIDELKGEEKEL